MILSALVLTLLSSPPAPPRHFAPPAAPFAVAAAGGAFAPPFPPPPPGAPDALEARLYSPELVMRRQKELGLDEKQKNAIADEVARAQGDVVRSQFKLQAATEELADLLDGSPVDEKKALAKADEVMALERDVKRTNLAMRLRVKNLLTADQRTKLDEMREDGPGGEYRRAMEMAGGRRSRETGRLAVAAPAGSVIQLDGKEVGNGGSEELVLDVPPGNHMVTVVDAAGKKRTHAVSLRPGGSTSLVIAP